ncbi:MAG TPA: nucleotidyltransferase domain-containing protein [Candidatus Nanoarchaeia archaeon]|nr:nucleotidyltransferase domain-containing protein [Candidatus Nanoarchaeia archaeon]
MYINTLSQTGERIIGFLLNNLKTQFSIRELAKKLGQDYKIVFLTAKTLEKEKIIEIKRVSNINQCSIHLLQKHAALFAYVSERLAFQKLPQKVWHAINDIIANIDNPCYAILLFGSYAKGTMNASSDVDLLFIVSRKEKQIEAASMRAATLNNIPIHPIILTMEEFRIGLKQESVSSEAYKKHFIIKGGEMFYSLISNA